MTMVSLLRAGEMTNIKLGLGILALGPKLSNPGKSDFNAIIF
jgi:hypothetical protein